MILVIVVLVLLLLLNYVKVESFVTSYLEEQILIYGFIGIFVAIFLLELVPQPILSALLPLATGIYFGLNYYNVLALSIFASVLSNYTSYFLGLIYGEDIVRFFVSERNYNNSVVWFDNYGKIGISLLALTPLPYFPIMGGMFKMKVSEFTVYAIVPRIIHFLVFSYFIFLAVV
tara:strand:+ start:1584 stop:2105 length:522 start_codon:yes stop_codon:yes gene_type:complete